MQHASRFVAGEDEFESANRQTASLAGLAVALFLVIVGLYLFYALHQKSRVEDCLMAGRWNCDTLVASVDRAARRPVR